MLFGAQIQCTYGVIIEIMNAAYDYLIHWWQDHPLADGAAIAMTPPHNNVGSQEPTAAELSTYDRKRDAYLTNVLHTRSAWWVHMSVSQRHMARAGRRVGSRSEPLGIPGGDIYPELLGVSDSSLCTVCLTGIEPEERVMTECFHYYHYDCINKAYQHNLKCPTCRHEPLLIPVLLCVGPNTYRVGSMASPAYTVAVGGNDNE